MALRRIRILAGIALTGAALCLGIALAVQNSLALHFAAWSIGHVWLIALWPVAVVACIRRVLYGH